MVLSGSDVGGTVRPLIGLTTYYQPAAWGVWKGDAALIPGSYLAAITAAGGVPVLLPPVGTDVRVLSGLDGLITAGGTDVDPSLYGQDPHPLTLSQPSRDTHDFALTTAALAAGMPLLAICRGAQVLNVALGGTLIQHLPDIRAEADYRPAPGVFGEVSFTTAPDSIMESLLGGTGTAPCYHHQGIADPGRGLRVTAVAPEGTVEAIEQVGHGWVLGVQFHPEQNPADLRLFDGFITAAAGFRERKSAPVTNLEGIHP